MLILVLLILLFLFAPIDKVVAAFLCAMLMIGTRCVTGTEARASINWQVLIVIGAAMGMGRAMDETGAASALAQRLLDTFSGVGPHGMLMLIFAIAALFAQLVTNYGAAILMFPLTMVTARDLDVSPLPFLFVLMVGAGSTYISPFGYQTNLMVYGPGSYRFGDFVRMGIPLTIVTGIVCTLIAPLVFPFGG
jgi:di/tricarboxylate transporter